ncbi:transposable element Tc1 transposase [Trichonephila clavipes]|nr:transposable element Tc1 transposase [Trichonephila clavipes]
MVKMSVVLRFRIVSMTEEMPRCRIRAHYKQLSEFERDRIIGLKEARGANRRIARHDDESRFQLCPDDHRSRVWRRRVQRANPAFSIARQISSKPGVMVRVAISLDSRTPLTYFSHNKTRPQKAHVAMNCLTACQTLLGEPDHHMSLQSSMSGI